MSVNDRLRKNLETLQKVKENKVALADLKNNVEDLREIQQVIVSLSNSKFVTTCLIDMAIDKFAAILYAIKELDDSAFLSSVENVEDFIWDYVNPK